MASPYQEYSAGIPKAGCNGFYLIFNTTLP
jgi:hypothetical protein